MIISLVGKDVYRRHYNLAQHTSGAGMFNLEDLEAPTLHDLSEKAATPPLMGNFRYIIIRSLKNLKPAATIEYLQKGANSVVFLFDLESLPKSDKLSAWLLKNSKVEKYDPFDDLKAVEYVKSRSAELGIQWEDDNVPHYFVFLVGNDTGNIHNELDRLPTDQTINANYIGQNVDRYTEVDSFKLLDLVLSSPEKGYRALTDYYTNQGTSLDFVNLLLWKLQQLITYKLLKEEKVINRDIPKLLNVNRYAIQFLAKSGKQFSLPVLQRAYIDLEYLYYSLLSSKKGARPVGIIRIIYQLHNQPGGP